MNRYAESHLILLLQQLPPLAMTQHRPSDTAVFQLCDADLAREGSIGLVEDVLSGHLDALVQVFTRKEKVECRWGDDNLCEHVNGRL